MARLIDADALADELMERYCNDCDRRKGIKNGKYRIIYNIGDVPCRACAVGDMKDELEDAPIVDAVPVVRCGECKYFDLDSWANIGEVPLIVAHEICKRWGDGCKTSKDGFCFMGERKE